MRFWIAVPFIGNDERNADSIQNDLIRRVDQYVFTDFSEEEGKHYDYYDFVEVKEAQAFIEEDIICQALITPEGKYIESPEYFFGVNELNEKAFNSWKIQFHSLLAEYPSPQYLVALYRCHI